MGQYSDDSHARFWSLTTVSAGTPTLINSFNVTSITDTATGQLTVTIATDFSNTSWCCTVTGERVVTTLGVTNVHSFAVRNAGQAAGTILVECWDDTAGTHVAKDPNAWHVAGFGTQ